MLLIDPENGCIMDANPAASNYYQYDRGTLLKMKISDINTMSTEALAAEIKQANEKKRSQFYFHHRLANGEIRDVEVFSGPIIVAGKQLLYSIILDVTDRKKMEEALQKSNRELDDFAYIASHDLREPLRGISNYATFLMEDYSDKIDAEGKNKLETLKRLCKREEDLIQSLLTYSQVGRTDLVYTPVDLNGLIDEVKETIESSFPDQTIQIVVSSRLPTIQCDAIRVGEVFFNLISNAIKYNEKPEKQIEIGYLQNDTGKWNLPESRSEKIIFPVYYVRDNGIGIHEKHRDKIFMIFKRLHGRDKFGGGTGAGLTIVKKIIERHGGMIWLDSEVGKGTTFYFTLSSQFQND
jgi:PAS domain S-box-containing protein